MKFSFFPLFFHKLIILQTDNAGPHLEAYRLLLKTILSKTRVTTDEKKLCRKYCTDHSIDKAQHSNSTDAFFFLPQTWYVGILILTKHSITTIWMESWGMGGWRKGWWWHWSWRRTSNSQRRERLQDYNDHKGSKEDKGARACLFKVRVSFWFYLLIDKKKKI